MTDKPRGRTKGKKLSARGKLGLWLGVQLIVSILTRGQEPPPHGWIHLVGYFLITFVYLPVARDIYHSAKEEQDKLVKYFSLFLVVHHTICVIVMGLTGLYHLIMHGKFSII